MKRAVLSIALGVALLAGVMPARSDMVGPGTEYCDGQAARSRGEGSPSQAAVHTKIFARAFAKACGKEAGLVSYLGTGTRRGFLSMMARRVPFAGSDIPLSTSDWALVQKGDYTWNSPVHQIPLYVDGWAIAYNLPCAGPQLKLRSQTLALIYQGVITSWNDTILSTDNEWLATCNQRIRLARRADDAAATDAFQDYLAKRNPNWIPYRRGVTPQRWPTSAFACSGLGDAGMINCVRSFRGSIGYVSIATAKALRLKVALVENASGSLVPPTPAACTAAAATAVPPPGTSPVALPNGTTTAWVPATQGDWSTVSIADAIDGYPICSFTYLIILQNWLQGYAGFMSTATTRATVDYFTVALSKPTQASLAAAGYASLPESMRKVAMEGISAVSFYRYTTTGGV
jgi:ABC-type phosphate transport system substrate-binding protein